MSTSPMHTPSDFDPAAAERLNQEAVAWAMRHENGDWSDQDSAAFEAWCAADPRHLRAYREAVRTLADLSAMGQMAEFAGLMPAPTLRERIALAMVQLRDAFASPRVRMTWAAAAAAVALILVVGQIYLHPSAYKTAVGEIRAVTLADGTVVTLSADSRIEIDFSEAQRHVTLAHGEAFFAVTKNPGRPFVVAVGETVVRVVGTKFDVHRGAEEVRVAVLEGIVEVLHPADPLAESADTQAAAPVVDTITAGRQIVTSRTGTPRKSMVTQIAKPGAWRSGRLDYDGATLREVIADINRYYPAGVELESDDLGNLKVTSSFRPSQIDQMIDSLTLALPIEVERQTDGELILRHRR